MNDFDKNFHLNMSPLYATFVFMLFMLWASEVKGDEIEEIVVTAQQEKVVKADPITSSSLMSAIMPAFTWNAGGYGGFVGFNERGAQTSHTSVYVNGIPANDPGASWYDFGHDFASGQTVKVISGANGVIYGSGSIAGTILIQDTIERGITYRGEALEPTYVRVAPIDQLEFSMVKSDMDSVRNDNDEEDNYKNKTARFNVDVGDFTIVGKFTEYEYDYDNCYNYDWNQSNDCVQEGERYNFAIRNDLITIGRNYNNADYFTNDVSNEGTFLHQDQTYANESYRDYFRFGNQLELSKNLNIAFGVDLEKQTYNTVSWQNVEGTTVIETEVTEPGIWYAEDDTNKSRPMWTGDFIGTGEFTSTTVGDGVFTLTEIQENYTDENGGIYFQANANFILNYNFGIRLGNDNQNALRLGIEKGDWFFNLGNSFRKANLYEKFGDGYVQGNEDLDPEKGIGIEFGYGVLSVFMYDFEEAIEYVPGYNTDIKTTEQVLDIDRILNENWAISVDEENTYIQCVMDPNWTENDEATFELPGCHYKFQETVTQVWTAPTYANTGEYTTQGIRYANNFGPLFVSLKFTDTDQARVPKYAGVLQYSEDFFDVNFRLKYAFNLDRAPSEYDVLPEGEEYLEDLNKLNLYITKEFVNGITVSFKAENITDEVVEVVPFYNSEGREIYLTLDYKW